MITQLHLFSFCYFRIPKDAWIQLFNHFPQPPVTLFLSAILWDSLIVPSLMRYLPLYLLSNPFQFIQSSFYPHIYLLSSDVLFTLSISHLLFKILFLLVFEHFIQYIYIIFSLPPTLPRSTPHFSLTQFGVFYILNPQDQFVLLTQRWVCGLPLELGHLTRGQTVRENCLSLSWQLMVANNSSARGRMLCLFPISVLGFGLTWACIGPVQGVVTAMSL